MVEVGSMNKLVCLFSTLLIVGAVQAQGSDSAEPPVESAQANPERQYNRRGDRGKKGRAMLERVDTNKDGKVDLNEFLANAESRFQKMDLDSDGYVTPEERREVGDKMREKHREMREKHRQRRKQEREQRRAERDANE